MQRAIAPIFSFILQIYLKNSHLRVNTLAQNSPAANKNIPFKKDQIRLKRLYQIRTNKYIPGFAFAFGKKIMIYIVVIDDITET